MSPAQQDSVRRIVIVGASLGGGSAAIGLREQGFDGEVVLIGDEAYEPYERPPLSKAILLGDAEEPDWVQPSDYWESQDVTLLTDTRVTSINPAGRTVAAGDTDYPYDRLLLATGSEPRRLTIAGSELKGLVTLRTLDDSLTLRDNLRREGSKVVIVGAGWIGCEVAAAARKHGADVVMVDPLSQPLVRVLGDQIGAVFAGLHRDHGVDLRLGIGVDGFTEGATGTVGGVRLSDGSSIPADLVVVGVGVIPRVELAEAARLQLDAGGVAVDAALRTSDPAIFAVGDIAAQDHPRLPGRVRVEHWANAKDQGAHVAANLLGGDLPYTSSPFFFSDQYDLGCEYRGLADASHDHLVVRGDVAGREFTAFWLRDGVVSAAMNVNQWDDGDALQRLVDSGATVTEDDLLQGRF